MVSNTSLAMMQINYSRTRLWRYEMAEYFVTLSKGVIRSDECNNMVNSEGLIGTTEYLTL
jgi:hypothetical protein